MSEFEHDLEVFELFAELGEGIEFAADVVGFGDDLLGGFLVVPESFGETFRSVATRTAVFTVAASAALLLGSAGMGILVLRHVVLWVAGHSYDEAKKSVDLMDRADKLEEQATVGPGVFDRPVSYTDHRSANVLHSSLVN